MSPEFLVTSFVVVIAPGTGVLYTLACGISGGTRSGFAAAVGCTLGVIPHLAAAILGASAIFHSSALAYDLLKYAGASYLLYMAWSTLQDTGTLSPDDQDTIHRPTRIIVRGFLVNILNPKLALFFLAFLPQFTPFGSNNPTLSMLFLAAIFMLMTFVVFAVYGLFSAGIRSQLFSSPTIMIWINRLIAAAFIGLAIKLVLL